VAVPLLVFAPLVFLAHLLFLAGSEVVLDVESLADLLGGLALDHVGDSLAGHIKKAFNVQVVSSLKNVAVKNFLTLTFENENTPK
jgi:hypothetical protein